jgi:predicted nucleic acid-binding protein
MIDSGTSTRSSAAEKFLVDSDVLIMRKVRRSHSGVGLADYLIAATAMHAGLELGTLNVRHFPMFPELQPAFAR